MCGDECPNRIEAAILRSERAWWESLYRRAVERAEVERQAAKAEFERGLEEERIRTRQLEERVAELEAKVRLREQQLFGVKTEQTGGSEGKGKKGTTRPKGQQRNARGHGRRGHNTLPVVVEEKTLPPEARHCPCCGLAYEELAGTEDSEELEIEVKAHRRVYRRRKYLRKCQCPGLARIITAPRPSKLIPKGKYSVSIWVMVLLDKFLFQRPTYRLLLDLKTYGLDIAQGSLADGLKRLLPFFKPLRDEIIEHQREATHWHADETRWMVFVEVEGKVGHRWFLWMVCSADTVVFILDPSRSAKVPIEHFGDAQGIVSADRYSAYKTMANLGRLLIAYCWAHVRRDFLAVAKGWPEQEAWALAWVERIRELYSLNEQRVALWKAEKAYAAEQAKLETQVALMQTEWKAQLADVSLHPAARKKLESLERHWSGLLLFVDHPWVPMDNNTAEREQRGPVVGRKNYYGSGSLESGELTATLFSVFHTLRRCGINPRPWLHAYLQACAEAGSKAPADFASFLPWNMSEVRRQEWTMPGTPPLETKHESGNKDSKVLRPGIHRVQSRGDPPHHRGGPKQNQVGDFAAGM
jgi:transposase